jgi:hypothetical protein
MAANISVHTGIFPVQTVSGNTEKTDAQPELAGQTFKGGVPTQLTAAGFMKVWDGATIAAGIAGVSSTFGQNLATNGAGAPQPGYGQVGGTKSLQTYGSVPNEPNAVNIALGTPAIDGRTLYWVANQDTIFQIQVDNSAGAAPADYTPTSLQMVGKSFGITFDAGGTCYLDANKNTVGTNTVFLVLDYDSVDGNQVNGHVLGKFLTTATQLG